MMRAAIITLALLAIPGCVQWSPPPDEGLQASSIVGADAVRGTVVLTDGLTIAGVRLTVSPDDAAPRGTSAAPVDIAHDASQANTALVRDHWALRLELREARPGAIAGQHRIGLEWNGEDKGEIRVVAGAAPRSRLGEVTLRFDLGPSLEASSVYVLTAARV